MKWVLLSSHSLFYYILKTRISWGRDVDIQDMLNRTLDTFSEIHVRRGVQIKVQLNFNSKGHLVFCCFTHSHACMFTQKCFRSTFHLSGILTVFCALGRAGNFGGGGWLGKGQRGNKTICAALLRTGQINYAKTGPWLTRPRAGNAPYGGGWDMKVAFLGQRLRGQFCHGRNGFNCAQCVNRIIKETEVNVRLLPCSYTFYFLQFPVA